MASEFRPLTGATGLSLAANASEILTRFPVLVVNRSGNEWGKYVTKEAGLSGPQHPPAHLNYEKDCTQMLSPLVSDILARAEVAGWDRRHVASALMYLAAVELRPKG